MAKLIVNSNYSNRPLNKTNGKSHSTSRKKISTLNSKSNRNNNGILIVTLKAAVNSSNSTTSTSNI